MEEIVRHNNLPPVYTSFAKSQDQIGWRRFLEGMVSREICPLLDEACKMDITLAWKSGCL
jgi:hypothetical protein